MYTRLWHLHEGGQLAGGDMSALRMWFARLPRDKVCLQAGGGGGRVGGLVSRSHAVLEDCQSQLPERMLVNGQTSLTQSTGEWGTWLEPV